MEFNLEKYLSDGIEQLIKDALKVTFKNPKQSAFFLRFAKASKTASKRRNEFKEAGKHIPPFLIASITGDCNLNCIGCYSHANNPCDKTQELSSAAWERIFSEAVDMGIPVILLAGGEPLLRPDVIEAATKQKDILFPVFTNGTMLDETGIQLFEKHRNLVPVISIEGDEATTDSRRGDGMYKKVISVMHSLQNRGVLFGTSITVTSDNLDSVTDISFISELEKNGCKVILFVEYVPVEKPGIALNEKTRDKLAEGINDLRASQTGMIIISFPGDEAESGGCLAAGRGFFHISASGNAEPCPFSPYSDMNITDTPLIDALDSPLFTRLREEGLLTTPHTGGCVLFEQESVVASLVSEGVL